MIATYRRPGPDYRGPLAATISDLDRHARSLRLDGLAPEEVRRLLSARTGAEPAAQLVSSLHRTTAGNPFFLLAVLESLASGEREPTDGSAVPLPPSVQDAVRARLAGLSARCTDVLATAAVLGWRFRADTLEAMTGHPGPILADLLDEALAAGIVVGTDGTDARFRLRHALISETLYDGIAPSTASTSRPQWTRMGITMGAKLSSR